MLNFNRIVYGDIRLDDLPSPPPQVDVLSDPSELKIEEIELNIEGEE